MIIQYSELLATKVKMYQRGKRMVKHGEDLHGLLMINFCDAQLNRVTYHFLKILHLVLLYQIQTAL